MTYPSWETMGGWKRRRRFFCCRSCGGESEATRAVETARITAETSTCKTKHCEQKMRVHVDDAVVESDGDEVSIRAELDDGRVQLAGGVLGFQNKIFDFAAGIHARFPAAEAAAAVSDGEAAVAAVQIEAHYRLQDVLAEYACRDGVTGARAGGGRADEARGEHCLVSRSQHLMTPS